MYRSRSLVTVNSFNIKIFIYSILSWCRIEIKKIILMKNSPKIEFIIVINLIIFTLLIGANHVVVDKLLIGQNQGLQYDITLIALILSHLGTVIYYSILNKDKEASS